MPPQMENYGTMAKTTEEREKLMKGMLCDNGNMWKLFGRRGRLMIMH
jgi:hypothetical protein